MLKLLATLVCWAGAGVCAATAYELGKLPGTYAKIGAVLISVQAIRNFLAPFIDERDADLDARVALRRRLRRSHHAP